MSPRDSIIRVRHPTRWLYFTFPSRLDFGQHADEGERAAGIHANCRQLILRVLSMDNVTHTLIGALIGDAAATKRNERTTTSEKRGRALLVWISAIGSNFPDCDLLYTAIDRSKLSYLVQHRGYTHTILGALFAGVLLYFAALLFARWRGWTLTPGDRKRIGAIGFIAPLLHIAMDFTNNYGVHPFWPWYDGWFYGDTVFIIEPLFWAACAPLAFSLESSAGRILVRIVLLAAIVLPVATHLVPLPNIICIGAIIAGLLWIAHRGKRVVALSCGIACWLAVTATFAASHSQASKLAHRINREDFGNAKLLDTVLTPLPANPLCWETIFIDAEADHLVLRRAMLTIAPSIIEASTCPTRSLDRPTTAELHDVNAIDSPSIRWRGEVHSDLSRLRRLNDEHCQAATFFRFARAPFMAQLDDREVIGDLRYDREAALGFTELELPSRMKCDQSAPWLPPRADVLGAP
jgi:inner membrane protein